LCEKGFRKEGKTCVREACSPGYILYNNQCWSRKCTINEKRDANGECKLVSCPVKGYELDKKSNTCILKKCVEKDYVLEDGKCIKRTCKDDFVMEGKKCRRVKCSTGFTLNAKKECVRSVCEGSKYVLKNGKCKLKECPKDFTMVDGDCVRDCPQYFKLFKEDGKCRRTGCPDTHIFNEKTSGCMIKECPTDYKKDKEGVCHKVECSEGFKFINDKCLKIECPTNYKMVDDKCVRYKCDEGLVWNGKHCFKKEKCADGYKEVDNKCRMEECPKDGNKWTKTADG